MTLSELVYGPVCTSVPAVDRALQISEAIDRYVELEAQLEVQRVELDDLYGAKERADKLERALANLVEAIKSSEIVTTARVGQLLVVDGSRRAMAPAFAEALRVAEEAI